MTKLVGFNTSVTTPNVSRGSGTEAGTFAISAAAFSQPGLISVSASTIPDHWYSEGEAVSDIERQFGSHFMWLQRLTS